MNTTNAARLLCLLCLLGASFAVAGTAAAAPVTRSAWLIDFSTCATPEYPKAAQRNEHTGTVDLEFLVRSDGTIAATLIKSSSGHLELDQAAQDALSKCRFKLQAPVPPKEDIWQPVRYVWTLEDNDGPLPRQIDPATCARAPYPARARDTNMTGSLSLRLLVRPDGTVRDTNLLRTSGHPELDNAARTAMAACRFTDGASKPSVDEWVTMEYVWVESDLPAQARQPKK